MDYELSMALLALWFASTLALFIAAAMFLHNKGTVVQRQPLHVRVCVRVCMSACKCVLCCVLCTHTY